MDNREPSTTDGAGQERGPAHLPTSHDSIERPGERLRNASYAGYEYQVSATIWVVLDLLFAKNITSDLTVEPQSREDLEATVHKPEIRLVRLRASDNSIDIMFQFKTRSGAPWSAAALARVLKGSNEHDASDPRVRVRPLETLRANQAARYVFITNEALAESLRVHAGQDILDIPRATNLPPHARDGYDASTQAAIAPRLLLCGGVTEEILTTRIRDLLTIHCHVPSINLVNCLTDLREEVRKRILGFGAGHWTRAEVADVIAGHGGSWAPTSAMDHYVAPRCFDAIRDKLERSHVVLIVGPWGTGKTLTADVIEFQLRQSPASFAVVGERYGPSAIRDYLTSVGPVLFHLRDPWGGSRLSSDADRWSTELPKLLTQAGPNKKFLITSRLDVLQRAAQTVMADFMPHRIVIGVEDYGADRLQEIYDRYAGDLTGHAQAVAEEYREVAVRSMTRPYEIERFLAAVGAEDESDGQGVHDLIAAACDPRLVAAEDLLEEYVTAFRGCNTFQEQLVPFTCRSEGERVSSDDVTRVVVEERADVLLLGPSGCGKTLLATHLALGFTESGGIAVMVRGMDYTGDVNAVIQRETRLLVRAEGREVLDAATALKRPVLLVVDGYNECAESERGSLTRELVALTRDYQATVLVTSQDALVHEDLLTIREVTVPPTEPDTKETIARNVLGGHLVTSSLGDLLAAATTGLEAKLIGEVGRDLDPGSSKYALFDAYARARLGGSQSEGLRLLSKVAGRLCERVAFTMSRRDLDRLMDVVAVSQQVAMRVRESGLLVQRGDRVHFRHEMFFDAFAAEDVIRSAAEQASAVMTALAWPGHADRKDLIIGAIDNDLVLEQVLDRLVDAASIGCCLAGTCGRKAQEWAEANSAALWERLRSEAVAVRFLVAGEGSGYVAFDESSLTTWSPSEVALLGAIGRRLTEGYRIEEALETVGIMDRRIAEEATRLREVHGRTFRSKLFAAAYAFRLGPAPGIAQIVAQVQRRFLGATSKAVRQSVDIRLTEGTLSSGQLYLLLSVSGGGDIPAATIARSIECHWADAPYHLRLDLMAAARMFGSTDREGRDGLISAIEAIPQTKDLFTSTAIVDALAALGALEDSERDHIVTVREEIRQCLAHPKDNDRRAQAYRIYAAQFEHPYFRAYYEAIGDLNGEHRKSFLTMAVDGAEVSGSCVELLLMDLGSLGDPSVAVSLARWTTLPPPDCFAPQEGVAAFLIAHIALARLHRSLPVRSSVMESRSASALTTCGEILYWCNRDDLDKAARQLEWGPLLRLLVEHAPGASLDALKHCEWRLPYPLDNMPGESPIDRSIVSKFPDEACEICRRSLADPTSEVGYFRYYSSRDATENLKFAIELLAQHGNSTDLGLLRGYARDAVLGTAAIAAVRTVDSRLSFG